ncbi:hypothetical protein J4464_01140 [Candidatus Woesearchaeota archaeon]|nr:hypothetical protein [Candidatus Woesearchaeota archaeon]
MGPHDLIHGCDHLQLHPYDADFAESALNAIKDPQQQDLHQTCRELLVGIPGHALEPRYMPVCELTGDVCTAVIRSIAIAQQSYNLFVPLSWIRIGQTYIPGCKDRHAPSTPDGRVSVEQLVEKQIVLTPS